jgi:hypothetical protein
VGEFDRPDAAHTVGKFDRPDAADALVTEAKRLS